MTEKSSDSETHPFAGCNRLLGHYKTIGTELLSVESRRGIGSFREGVSFVPVEVLESFLEDLLDLEVSEDALFIHRERTWFNSLFVALSGLLIALAGGLYLASTGTSILVSFGLTSSLAFPFAVLIHFFPRSGLTRRMNFAQVLSSEISRRRGRDKDASWPTNPLLIGEMFAQGKGPIQGAARKIFH